MAIANFIININRRLDWIENHIRSASILLSNSFNIIDGIKSSLNNI